MLLQQFLSLAYAAQRQHAFEILRKGKDALRLFAVELDHAGNGFDIGEGGIQSGGLDTFLLGFSAERLEPGVEIVGVPRRGPEHTKPENTKQENTKKANPNNPLTSHYPNSPILVLRAVGKQVSDGGFTS